MYAYKRLIRNYSTENKYNYRLYTILVQAPGPAAPAPVKFRPRHITSKNVRVGSFMIRSDGSEQRFISLQKRKRDPLVPRVCMFRWISR